MAIPRKQKGLHATAARHDEPMTTKTPLVEWIRLVKISLIKGIWQLTLLLGMQFERVAEPGRQLLGPEDFKSHEEKVLVLNQLREVVVGDDLKANLTTFGVWLRLFHGDCWSKRSTVTSATEAEQKALAPATWPPRVLKDCFRFPP